MITKIKNGIREVLTEKYDGFYQMELAEKTCTYDKWIRKKEMSDQGESMYQAEMPEYQGSDDLKNKKTCDIKKGKTEYFIFVDKKGNLTDIAEKEIEKIFASDSQIQVIYSDEDEVNHEENVRMNPWFKPDYSPETLMSYFYFGGFVAVRRDLAVKVLNELEQQKEPVIEIDESDRKQLYSLILHICMPLNRKQVFHSEKMLYTSHTVSRWGWEDEYNEIKEKAWEKRERSRITGVSIIIPSKDNPEVLRRCLVSILQYTKDIPYEIILIDNGSNVKNRVKIEGMRQGMNFTYVYQPMEFNFSAMCNLGAKKAKGELLLFLNDDCEARTPGWLSRLAMLASIKDTGAVGAKLYYPDSKKIQHCGIYNFHMGPAHKLQFKEDDKIYYDRRNRDVRNVLGVTAACLMVRKEVFEQANGFDESLKVAFNDVDFCYRLYEMGYNNVINNEIYLWHHESLSRGSDESPQKQSRLMSEKQKLYQKHSELWNADPYYSRGFTTHILDTGYSFAYEYDYEKCTVEVPEELQGLPSKIREDACVAPLIEYAGCLENWFMDENVICEIRKKIGTDEVAYLQGSSVVIGSDNACFETYILFRHEETEKLYQIQPDLCYRPDIFNNLLDQKNVGLSGFVCLIDMRNMGTGKYFVDIMVRDKISKQYILRKTTRTIENVRKKGISS